MGTFKHFIPDRCISRSQCGEDLSPEDSNVDNMSIATDNPDIDIEMSAIPAGPAPAGELAPPSTSTESTAAQVNHSIPFPLKILETPTHTESKRVRSSRPKMKTKRAN